MTPTATLLWLLVIVFDTVGQLAFKAAATIDEDLDGLARWRHMLKDKWIWIGVGSYVIEFFSWLAFLSFVPLSMGVLVGSINIFAVMLGGRIFFKEPLSASRVTAITLIAIGVALVGWA
ncbi:MAG: hypothetical protein KC777_20175 [Cyanobacteria bacterium HKST-UBA02]|nr:hypothetical protein [Cyanobacteria bacterium HKST-UBA02]